jgi:TonB-dependent SusC/RagA subfamily outer membrane receptor
MFRSNDPLVFVDGVKVTRATRDAPSVLDQLSPPDVSRIDVLRGPAATALYGTDASSGVVLIYTRRGGADTSAATLACG